MLENILYTLKKYNKFAIVSHLRMDGDAMGSMMGLTYVLHSMGKQVQPLTQGLYPDNLRGLPGTQDIQDIYDGWKNSWYPEVLICVDSASRERVCGAIDNLTKVQLVLNIDHHVSNEFYGTETYNWVESQASSTGEMLIRLCYAGYLPIPPEAATHFYAAMITDTGNFTYANTTPEALQYASNLLRLGVTPNKLVEEIYQSKTCNWLHLEGRVLSRVANYNDQIIWSYVPFNDFQETSTSPKDSGSLVSMLTKIQEYQIIVLFIEQQPGQVKLSFRGRGTPDLSEIASKWEGGGGHPRAAGTTITGSLEDVMVEVIDFLKSLDM